MRAPSENDGSPDSPAGPTSRNPGTFVARTPPRQHIRFDGSLPKAGFTPSPITVEGCDDDDDEVTPSDGDTSTLSPLTVPSALRGVAGDGLARQTALSSGGGSVPPGVVPVRYRTSRGATDRGGEAYSALSGIGVEIGRGGGGGAVVGGGGTSGRASGGGGQRTRLSARHAIAVLEGEEEGEDAGSDRRALRRGNSDVAVVSVQSPTGSGSGQDPEGVLSPRDVMDLRLPQGISSRRKIGSGSIAVPDGGRGFESFIEPMKGGDGRGPRADGGPPPPPSPSLSPSNSARVEAARASIMALAAAGRPEAAEESKRGSSGGGGDDATEVIGFCPPHAATAPLSPNSRDDTVRDSLRYSSTDFDVSPGEVEVDDAATGAGTTLDGSDGGRVGRGSDGGPPPPPSFPSDETVASDTRRPARAAPREVGGIEPPAAVVAAATAGGGGTGADPHPSIGTGAEATQLNRVAADLLSRGRSDEALSAYRRAISGAQADMAKIRSAMSKVRAYRGANCAGGKEWDRLNARLAHVAGTVADVLNNMGVAYEMRGWYGAALASCRNALDVYVNTCRRSDGGGDADVERTKRNIAQMEVAKECHERRRELHELADELEGQIDREIAADGSGGGGDRRASSSRRRRIASLRSDRLDALRSAVHAERNGLGPSHPAVAATCMEMGRAHLEMGDRDEALREMEHAASVYRNSLGDRHPEVGRALARLATVYDERGEEGDDERALALFAEAAGALRASIGRCPELGAVLNNAGAIHQSRGDNLRAIEAFYDASNAYRGRGDSTEDGAPPSRHPDLADVWTNIGELHACAEEWDEALDAFEFSLLVLIGTRRAAARGGGGEASDATLVTRDETSRGGGGRSLHLPGAAEPAPLVRPRSVGEMNLLIASALRRIGIVQTELRHHDRAMDSFGEALRIYHTIDGDGTGAGDVADLLRRMGDTQERCGNLTAAMGMYEECLALLRRTSTRDEEHVGQRDGTAVAVADVLGQIGSVHTKRRELDEAIVVLRESVRLYQADGFPESHPALRQVRSRLDDATKQKNHRSKKKGRVRASTSITAPPRRRSRPRGTRPRGSARPKRSPEADLARALDEKAESLRKRGDYDEAMAACVASLKIRREMEAEAAAAAADGGGGGDARGGGRRGAGRRRGGRARAATPGRRDQNKIDIGRTLRNVAYLHSKRREPEEARLLYDEALRLYRDCGLEDDHPYVDAVLRERKELLHCSAPTVGEIESMPSGRKRWNCDHFVGQFA